jgi:hypothetical protein
MSKKKKWYLCTMALLKNLTSETSRIGYCCKHAPNDTNSFVYATANDTNIIGIISQVVPKYSQCEIVSTGVTKVFVSESVVQGAIIRAAKRGDNISRGTCKAAKSTDTPYFRIGTALESGKGLIRVSLSMDSGSSAEGYVPYVGADKDVNIGDHFLTGRFIVRPSEAAVNLAPMIFQAGTLLTVPEAGTMEFDGTGIYLTPTTHRRFISLASDSIIATVTATTVAPTTLWTGITNANELKPYRVYVIKGCGLVNNVAAASNVTITVNFGATVVNTLITPVAKLTDDPWQFEVYLTIRTTGLIATGRISSFGSLEVATSLQRTINESLAVDTTIANDITVQAVWSVANASNWIRLTQVWLSTAD